MDGPRSPLAGELPEVISFLNKNLRSQYGWSIDEEYPTALSQLNIHNLRILKDNEVLAHAAMRAIFVEAPIGLLKVLVVGSVVTTPSHQRLGLSRQILEDCLRTGRQNNMDLAILWTDKVSFYEKFGFVLAGHELAFIIDHPLKMGTTPTLRYSNSQNVDPAALLRVYQGHTIKTVRSVGEVAAYLKIPNSQVFTAWDPDGQLVAYVVVGKGADFSGFIHEWGGPLPLLLSLLEYVRQQHRQPVTLICGTHSKNLARTLREQDFVSVAGHLGMIQILNVPQFFKKIERYGRLLGHQDTLLTQPSSHQFVVQSNSKKWEFSSLADCTRFLFNDKIQQSNLLFPLSFWLWGWDSI